VALLRPGTADEALAALAAGEAVDAGAMAVVVAHPDDETIGVGAQLPRLHGVTLVHVTDGAPRDGMDAGRHGFASPQAYAAARRAELEAAVALAGVPPEALIGFELPDQQAALHLADLARRLAALFAERGIRVALTHAFEGGHPDHEAVAFAVHAASRLDPGTAVIEMPFYRAGPEGWLTQTFVPDPRAPEIALWLDPAGRALKRRMLNAHASQGGALAPFSPDIERFRRAPSHDFTVLPSSGDLLYERYDWGMTGARWQALVRAAEAELGLARAA
jgi:LmbE family N-acetylglucosaminyl deacetylase